MRPSTLCAVSSPRKIAQRSRSTKAASFGVFAALLVACGASTLAWFATSPGPADAIQAAPEPKSPKSTLVHEVAPERPSSGAIPAAAERKFVSATIHLNSNPQGADATALGSGYRTPCSIELSTESPFAVTFTRKGFVPSTIFVEIEPAQPGGSDPKFVPDPIFVTLQALPAPEARTKPARSAARHGAPSRDTDANEEAPNDGLLSRSWKYLDQKRQSWQKELVRLFHVDAFR
jgi:hypothetical protein